MDEKIANQSDNSREVETRTIESQLIAVKEAAARTRYVFIILTIASASIVFTIWNANFSRERSLAFLSSEVTMDEGKMRDWSRKQILEQWYHNRVFHSEFLGIGVSATDFAFIGSITLVIITVWLYYAQRRENWTIVSLIQDVNGKYSSNWEMKNMVYQGITHNLVFIRTEETDEPLEGLERKSEKRVNKPTLLQKAQYYLRVIITGKNSLPASSMTTFTDLIQSFLFYLPFSTVLLIIFRDVWNLFLPSLVSGQDTTLGWLILEDVCYNLKKTQTDAGYMSSIEKQLGRAPCDCQWFSFYITDISTLVYPISWRGLGNLYPLTMLVLFQSVAIVCGVYIWKLCRRGRNFSMATKKTLMEFRRELDEEENRKKRVTEALKQNPALKEIEVELVKVLQDWANKKRQARINNS
ncbi:MAG: hypothetical protein M3384_20270 [Acidobacteriota bacterium]|nr:hypothetical protein [Acidobacteriota bacterium]